LLKDKSKVDIYDYDQKIGEVGSNVVKSNNNNIGRVYLPTGNHVLSLRPYYNNVKVEDSVSSHFVKVQVFPKSPKKDSTLNNDNGYFLDNANMRRDIDDYRKEKRHNTYYEDNEDDEDEDDEYDEYDEDYDDKEDDYKHYHKHANTNGHWWKWYKNHGWKMGKKERIIYVDNVVTTTLDQVTMIETFTAENTNNPPPPIERIVTETIDRPGITETIDRPGLTETILGPGITETLLRQGPTETINRPGLTEVIIRQGPIETIRVAGATETIRVPGVTETSFAVSTATSTETSFAPATVTTSYIPTTIDQTVVLPAVYSTVTEYLTSVSVLTENSSTASEKIVTITIDGDVTTVYPEPITLIQEPVTVTLNGQVTTISQDPVTITNDPVTVTNEGKTVTNIVSVDVTHYLLRQTVMSTIYRTATESVTVSVTDRSVVTQSVPGATSTKTENVVITVVSTRTRTTTAIPSSSTTSSSTTSSSITPTSDNIAVA